MEESINERLRNERKRIGITQQRLADLGGVSLNSQAKYETTDRKPDAKYLSRIWEIVDVVYILTGNKVDEVRDDSTSYNISQDEFVGIKQFKASMPVNTTKKDDEKHQLLYFRRNLLEELNLIPADIVAAYAPGDSMEPDIPAGSILFIDKSQKEVRNGLIYVFNVNNDLLVKKIIREFDGSYIARSINPEYVDRKLSSNELSALDLVGQARVSMPIKILPTK